MNYLRKTNVILTYDDNIRVDDQNLVALNLGKKLAHQVMKKLSKIDKRPQDIFLLKNQRDIELKG